MMGGRADEMKAGRKILKDYVDGKLCYCHPPPGVTHLKQRSDLLLGWSGKANGGEEEEEVVVQKVDFAELGAPGSQQNGRRPNDRRRPDYKFKKSLKGRKKKHAAGGAVQSDGGLAIGRKGGVIRVSSNY